MFSLFVRILSFWFFVVKSVLQMKYFKALNELGVYKIVSGKFWHRFGSCKVERTYVYLLMIEGCSFLMQLARRPLFFRETNPQPRKHTLWQATSDFTGGQACIHRYKYEHESILVFVVFAISLQHSEV